MTTPAPQLIVKPGGLTTGEHLGHIVAIFFTCGLWLPGYIYFAARAPRARYEVAIPYGADPAAVRALYEQVAVMNAAPQVQGTPSRFENRRVYTIALWTIFGLVVLFAVYLAIRNGV